MPDLKHRTTDCDFAHLLPCITRSLSTKLELNQKIRTKQSIAFTVRLTLSSDASSVRQLSSIRHVSFTHTHIRTQKANANRCSRASNFVAELMISSFHFVSLHLCSSSVDDQFFHTKLFESSFRCSYHFGFLSFFSFQTAIVN